MIFVVYNYSLLQDEIIGILSDSDRKHKPAVLVISDDLFELYLRRKTSLEKKVSLSVGKKKSCETS